MNWYKLLFLVIRKAIINEVYITNILIFICILLGYFTRELIYKIFST